MNTAENAAYYRSRTPYSRRESVACAARKPRSSSEVSWFTGVLTLDYKLIVKTNPPNQFRATGPKMGLWNSTDADGMNGAFAIPINHGHKIMACCIVSDGRCLEGTEIEPWEHVSVHIEEYGKDRTPTWDEMCQVKNCFWNDDETVVQFHPAKKDYVNCHPHVLHLWRNPKGFPLPLKVMV